MKQSRNRNIIISGGGTGGHVFPALSIAHAIRERDPKAKILFVGALGKMEMEKVPAAGYPIKGLPIGGFQRGFSRRALVSNFKLPFQLLVSILKSFQILRRFRPHAAVGVGGYASGPLLWAAARKKTPYLLQEQNSFAGKTNKKLAAQAAHICVAYPGMERFFPASKIVLTGNPIRENIGPATQKGVKEGLEYFRLNPEQKTILVIGGSLGAGTLNRCLEAYLPRAKEQTVQVLWQCGRNGIGRAQEALRQYPDVPVYVHEFIERMDLAFAVADLVVSRAGAGTISELCAAGKACIFVPSPNVAEDHQTHNAMALVKEKAGCLVPDNKAMEVLMDKALELVFDNEKLQILSSNVLQLSRPHAAKDIATLVLEL
ncbi:MAG: undecaprenyldiphospho-muramoylpentapeptide beta-N-acetylglucosaminyltransferase [Bacteroidales bacterium]|nr:undecaprenyldiphospho-muramoylpentapeptide beta-N-acetylglucosaminyltransferase [Bacteroidales bacterium]